MHTTSILNNKLVTLSSGLVGPGGGGGPAAIAGGGGGGGPPASGDGGGSGPAAGVSSFVCNKQCIIIQHHF